MRIMRQIQLAAAHVSHQPHPRATSGSQNGAYGAINEDFGQVVRTANVFEHGALGQFVGGIGDMTWKVKEMKWFIGNIKNIWLGYIWGKLVFIFWNHELISFCCENARTNLGLKYNY